MKNRYIVPIVIFLLGAILLSGCNLMPGAAKAKNGDKVEVNYTGKLTDGTVFDSSVAGEPIKFTIGSGEVIPGFDKAVVGMKVGEKKTVFIPVDEAYGAVRPELIGEIPRSKLPSDVVPEVGGMLQATAKDGSQVIFRITSVSDNTVTVDANNPLAGKDITFEIELVKIN